MTSSTSPPSNRSGGWPRTFTSPCAAPCPAPSCARSSPRPTTRSGGHPPRRSSTTTASLPVWHEASGNYLDPATGEFLPTWDQALDAIGPDDEPLHVARFGERFDAQGVIAGSRDANRCIGYLTKYLTKHVADCHQARTPAQHDHAERLADALRYEPCSPTCANWLRYGIQPKNPRPGLRPGHCKGKAHRREHLGYAGRRVLVSRKWSGKTLADHRADRKQLAPGNPRASPRTDPARYTWEPVTPGDPDHMPTRPAAAARRRRPATLARRAHRGQGESQRPGCPGSSGNREGGMRAASQGPSSNRPDDELMTGLADVRRAWGSVATHLLPVARTRRRPAMPQNPERRTARLAQ